MVIADDSDLMRMMLTRVLSDRSTILATVENGNAAVLAVQQFKPEIVLLDIAMPIMNGFEAAQQIKQLSPSVLIVFVSEHREKSSIQKAFEVGGSGYVLKSKVIPELLPAIGDVLAGNEYGRPTTLR